MAAKKKKPPAKEKKKKVRVASSKKKGRVQTKKTVKKTAKVLVKKKAKKPAKKTKKTIKKVIKKTKKTVKKTRKKGAGRNKRDGELMVAKLEPYLRSGLSIRKSCLQAGIDRTVVQRRMKSDDNFATKIAIFRDYKSVMMSEISVAIIKGLNNRIVTKGKNKGAIRGITKTELAALKLLVTSDRSLREEFGNKLSDDEVEKSVQFDKPETEREADLQARVLNKHHDYINKGKSVDDED